MKLVDLLKEVKVLKIKGNIKDLLVSTICDNTNKVEEGSLFVAIVGLRVDAHNLCYEAVRRGASALVVEKFLPIDLPQILVKNSKIALGHLANNFYKRPLKNIKVVTVVGTNGKTTTSYMIKQLLTHLGQKVGLIGTNGVEIGKKKLPSNLTTPDTLELFSLFNKMKKAKVNTIVMEVSAHAIALKKINAFKADIAIFTNFSQDHLDFFKNMNDYKNTKINYFKKDFCHLALIGSDDNVGQNLTSKTKAMGLPTFTYGTKKEANYMAKEVALGLDFLSFTIKANSFSKKVRLDVSGEFNIQNVLAAFGVCHLLGFSFSDIFTHLQNLKLPDGRFNILAVGKNCKVIIDYAHTPKALEDLLKNVYRLTGKKPICVFGCPGSRDELKRSLMGKIAAKYCSYIVLTSDNPDTENPLKIIEHIEKGILSGKCPYKSIESRHLAIAHALGEAILQKATTIVIAGKGHEAYQIINGIKVPYNDKETVLELSKKI